MADFENQVQRHHQNQDHRHLQAEPGMLKFPSRQKTKAYEEAKDWTQYRE